MSDGNEVLSADTIRRMRQEWIAMFDSDGEGRQLEGFDASDTHYAGVNHRRSFVTGDWSQTKWSTDESIVRRRKKVVVDLTD